MAINQVLRKKLQKELNALKELADRQTHHYVNTRALLYEGLAKVYVWWQTANKEAGLLESIYKENNIQYKKSINAEVNFSPILRYLWGVDGTVNSNKIDLWNRALNGVHVAVSADKAYYKQNAIQKIITHIDTNGGVKAFAGYDSTQSDDSNESKVKKTKVDVNVEKKRHEQHLIKGNLYFAKTATPLAKFTTKHTLPTADSSIGLALLRKTRSGYELLKAIDDKELIEKALIESYGRSNGDVPYTIRLLTEIIKTQIVPKPMQGLSRSLADKSKFKAEDGKPMQMLKRLLYMAEKRVFVLSANRSACSPVTIALPSSQIMDAKENVALNINDRTYIENSLIHSGDINFFATDTPSKLQVIKGESATHKLQLENTLSKQHRYVRFYPLSIHKNESTKQQAILKRGMKFKAIHTAKLDVNWLAELNGEFLSRWINGLGKSIKRKEFAVMALAFGKTGITFRYCQRANKYAEEVFVQYMHPNTTKTLVVEVLSKDIIPVLNSLVYSEIEGSVLVEVDTKAILFKYKTKTAQYIIAIPTCSNKGMRNEDHFQAYGA
jgi:hypothetical protein